MSNKEMDIAWDVLEKTQFSTIIKVIVPGILELTVQVDKTSLYDKICSRVGKAPELYMIYEWSFGRDVLLIHHIGTFSDCCMTLTRQGLT